MLSYELDIPTREKNIKTNDPHNPKSIPNEIQDAERKLIYLGDLISSTKEKLSAFQKKGNLTSEEQILMEKYKQEIKDTVSELHRTSYKLQTLLGLSNSDLELLIHENDELEENDDSDDSETLSMESTTSGQAINLETSVNEDARDDTTLGQEFTKTDLSQNEINKKLETISEEEVPSVEAHDCKDINSTINETLTPDNDSWKSNTFSTRTKPEVADYEKRKADESTQESYKISERMQAVLGVSESNLMQTNESHKKISDINCVNSSTSSSGSETLVDLGTLFNADDENGSECIELETVKNEIDLKLETISEEEIPNEEVHEWITIDTASPEMKQCTKNTDISSNYLKSDELIPKVVICGSDDGERRIIFCDQTNSRSDFPVIMTDLPYFLHKIMSMKEKSLIDIENLQTKRYYLQQELSEKDCMIEELITKVNDLETELNCISQKNITLKSKANMMHSMGKQPVKQENNEEELKTKEEVVHSSAEQCEEQDILLKCKDEKYVAFPNENKISHFQEEYNQMQEAIINKEKELVILQEQISEQASSETQVQQLLASSGSELSELEEKLNVFKSQMIEVSLYHEKITQAEQKSIMFKVKYFKAQDEAEKYRSLIREHAEETESYRKNYLKVKHEAEHFRRQIEIKETENCHIHNQVGAEILKVQNQFQDQLQMLTAIPEVINKLQLQVQEERQQGCIAEFRCRELAHEICDAKQQVNFYKTEMKEIQMKLQLSTDEQYDLNSKITDYEKESEELQREASTLKCNMETMLSAYEMAEKSTKEKINEISHLSKRLETCSDDFTHEFSRIRNQNEKTRISLQIKISELEDEILELQMQVKSMERDKEQVKLDLQKQINWLTEKCNETKFIRHELEVLIKNCQSSDNTFLTPYMPITN